MTIKVYIHEAKMRLSKLIQSALNGKTVIIVKDGSPVVKLTPIQAEGWVRPAPGLDKGKILILPGFGDPLEEFDI